MLQLTACKWLSVLCLLCCTRVSWQYKSSLSKIIWAITFISSDCHCTEEILSSIYTVYVSYPESCFIVLLRPFQQMLTYKHFLSHSLQFVSPYRPPKHVTNFVWWTCALEKELLIKLNQWAITTKIMPDWNIKIATNHSVLKMGAVYAFTLLLPIYQLSWCHIPGECNLLPLWECHVTHHHACHLDKVYMNCESLGDKLLYLKQRRVFNGAVSISDKIYSCVYKNVTFTAILNLMVPQSIFYLFYGTQKNEPWK